MDGLVTVIIRGRKFIFNTEAINDERNYKRSDPGDGSDSPQDGGENREGGLPVSTRDGDRDGGYYTGRRDDEDAPETNGADPSGDTGKPESSTGPEPAPGNPARGRSRSRSVEIGTEPANNPGELDERQSVLKMIRYHLEKAEHLLEKYVGKEVKK